MNISVLYVQTNEQVARTIKSVFDDTEIEFLFVPSAKDAFALFEEREITLTLVDASIPDMKLLEFSKKVMEKYPRMLLNVCMDIVEPKVLSKLTENSNVCKIFIPPLNVEDIVDGIYDSIDNAFISGDFIRRKSELKEEEERFEETLSKLKSTLVRQKYGYNKIERVFDRILEGSIRSGGCNPKLADYILRASRQILILETTTDINTSKVTEVINDRLLEIATRTGSLEIKNVDMCLMGDITKDKLVSVVYSVWLISSYEAVMAQLTGDVVEAEITSEYASSSEAVITMQYSGGSAKPLFESAGDDIAAYTEKILVNIFDNSSCEAEGDSRVYKIRAKM